jgi:peroxiredoxin
VRRILPCLSLLATFVAPCPTWALYGAASDRPSVGADAPRFAAALLEGPDFDLGPLLGQKAILLGFWSIYCVSCVQEIPTLVEIYKRHKEELEIVGIDMDSFGTKRVVQFVKTLDYRIPYPLVIDRDRQIGAKYGVSELPTTVLIDRTGKIAYYHVNYAAGDEAEIEKQVKKAIEAR